MNNIYTVTGTDANHRRHWRYMVRASNALAACRVANTQRPSWVSSRTLRAEVTNPATEPLLSWARARGFLREVKS